MMDSLDRERTPRLRYRPPVGVPLRGEPRAQATIASVLVHALILLLIVAPTLFLSAQLARFDQTGAGGPGPAGGGGGGNSGAGYPALKFVRERLDYLQIAVPAAKKDEAKKKPEALQTAVPEAKPEPVPPQPAEKSATVSDSAAAAGATSSGTGSDGSRGNGPGSGGGVGSGVGPGRGSGNGPGTGGGDALVYPPMVIAMPILPVPVPSRVRPYRLEAQFDVDSLGNATLIGFNPSRDAGYNRRIRDMLLEIRFRPAVRTDGRPVRALAVIKAEAM